MVRHQHCDRSSLTLQSVLMTTDSSVDADSCLQNCCCFAASVWMEILLSTVLCGQVFIFLFFLKGGLGLRLTCTLQLFGASYRHSVTGACCYRVSAVGL